MTGKYEIGISVDGPLRTTIIFLLFCLFLTACSMRDTLLVNPSTGAIVRCSSLSSPSSTIGARQLIEACTKKAQERGYVLSDKMTAQQRSELLRNGFIPVEALTDEQRMQVERRGILPRREFPLPR